MIINPYSFGFNPLSLSPALWLDGSDANTLYDATSGGSLVVADGTIARWEDKSGNARHATQATGINQPLRKVAIQNSKDIVRFDGSNDRLGMSALNLTAATVFTVVRRNTGNTYQSVAQINNPSTSRSSLELGINDDALYGPLIIGSNGNASLYGKGGSLKAGSFRITSGIWLGGGTSGASNYRLWDDGASVTLANSSTVGASNSTASVIGAAYSAGVIVSFLNGDIAEILVYPTALSDDDRAKVQNYLNNKYAIY